MAGWISSKLKVAENLLQQIDQQAAESLKKGERRSVDEESNISGTFAKADGGSGGDTGGSSDSGGVSVGISLKDQLKTRSNDKNDVIAGKLNLDRIRNDKASRKSGNNRDRDKEPPKSGAKPRPTLTDSDWTELLSTPKKSSSSKLGSVNNGGLGIRGLKKQGATIGGAGSNLNAKNGNNRVTGSVRKAGNGVAGKLNGRDGDGRISDAEETRNSVSTTSTQTAASDDRVVEGWEFRESPLVVDSANSTKEVGQQGQVDSDVTSRENGSNLQTEMANADVDSRGEMPRVNTEQIINLTNRAPDESNDGKDDEKIRMDSGTVGKTSMSIKRYVSHDPKRQSYRDSDDESDSDSESGSSSDSEAEREREERRKRRQQILAAKAAAVAAEAIKERENLVARLEGEKLSLEKILEERAKQAAQEASELQSSMMETMEAVDVEKQKHNNTMMEALTRLAKLETENAGLAKSLATAQWNFEIEVNRVAEIREQIESKEAALEELRRGILSTNQTEISIGNLVASKGIELEREMLEAEYSFLTDKIGVLQEKGKKLEESIELTRREMENPTEVEVELKRRLHQMTDHLIQKQAQVESLSSEKAMLLFRIEAVSKLLDENNSLPNTVDSSCDDPDSATWENHRSNLRPMLEDKIRSGKQHLGSFIRQLDAIFAAGLVFLRRNPPAKMWSLVYIVCLHIWVLYIFSSHSSSPSEPRSGATISLENLNSTGV